MGEEIIKEESGWRLGHSYATLPQFFYTSLLPVPVEAPKLIMFNENLAKDLGLNEVDLQKEDGAFIFAGNKLPPGAFPLAQAYGGHQFGHFAMLGDGRAILLGEQETPQGEIYDIQLKGSGETPYSRRGDGRATLGPMLREYIISEAMGALGIPTTRSLAVVTTGEEVWREELLPGAILTRVAASHIRVGTFQYAANWGTRADLKALADYTIKRHFVHEPTFSGENPYFYLFREVCKRQALLIAKWQLVGFIHGVMNTDNMTISGETIDYGPCAFMDTYDPQTVFSSIDREGRYAYGNQPLIAAWNLARFAEALLPLIHEQEAEAIKMVEGALDNFQKLYQNYWFQGMGKKLGLSNIENEDHILVNDLLLMMQEYQEDYTNTFRNLTLGQIDKISFGQTKEFVQWHGLWKERLKRQQEPMSAVGELMKTANPAVIPRNHRVEEALVAAVVEKNLDKLRRFIGVLEKPYAYTEEQEEYAEPPSPSACPYRTFCGT